MDFAAIHRPVDAVEGDRSTETLANVLEFEKREEQARSVLSCDLSGWRVRASRVEPRHSRETAGTRLLSMSTIPANYLRLGRQREGHSPSLDQLCQFVDRVRIDVEHLVCPDRPFLRPQLNRSEARDIHAVDGVLPVASRFPS